MTVSDVHAVLQRLNGFHGIYVPEFTYKDHRIDAAIVDVSKRWIRGFEIKINRTDFLRDQKWQHYAAFTSSLSVVCPEGLIRKGEVARPFGLLWITENHAMRWVQRPKKFQRRDALAWLYRYVEVLETEMPRLYAQVIQQQQEIKALQIDLKKRTQEGAPRVLSKGRQ